MPFMYPRKTPIEARASIFYICGCDRSEYEKFEAY